MTSNYTDKTGAILRAMAAIWATIRTARPLTHVITHQIAANDAANILLAAGASPICAEHPDEMEAIVKNAASLGTSLGNINPSRLAAIERAGRAAHELNKPCVIDCVGVAVSPLRLDFARRFIADFSPAVIKGNSSEIRALAGLPQHAHGVDAAPGDALGGAADWQDSQEIMILKDYARQNNAVLVATGAKDIIIDGFCQSPVPAVGGNADNVPAIAIANGTPLLAAITATGCMLAALVAAALGVCREATGNNDMRVFSPPFLAATAAAVAFGLAGERAAAISGANAPGTFHIALFDALARLDAAALPGGARLEIWR